MRGGYYTYSLSRQHDPNARLVIEIKRQGQLMTLPYLLPCSLFFMLGHCH